MLSADEKKILMSGIFQHFPGVYLKNLVIAEGPFNIIAYNMYGRCAYGFLARFLYTTCWLVLVNAARRGARKKNIKNALNVLYVTLDWFLEDE